MTTEPINAETSATNTEAGEQQQTTTTAANPDAVVKQEPTPEDDSTSLTRDVKAEEGKTDAPTEGDAEANKVAPEGAPEKYEFKAPENVSLDEGLLGKYSEVAKELNLSQEAAQKLIDAVAPQMMQRQAEVLKAARAEWKEASQADAEFGGANFAANLSTARKALDTFGTPKLVDLLNKSGLGEHPEVIRFFYKAGKSISEDRIQTGGTAEEPSYRDPATVLYGKTNQQTKGT